MKNCNEEKYEELLLRNRAAFLLFQKIQIHIDSN